MKDSIEVRRILGLMVAVLFLAAPAQANETTDDLSKGAALVGINLFYVPAKVFYAAAGGLVAGAAYVVSGGDKEVVDPILAASVRGDYVVEEAHLEGRRSVEFVGRRAEHERLRDVATEPPPSQGEDAGF